MAENQTTDYPFHIGGILRARSKPPTLRALAHPQNPARSNAGIKFSKTASRSKTTTCPRSQSPHRPLRRALPSSRYYGANATRQNSYRARPMRRFRKWLGAFCLLTASVGVLNAQERAPEAKVLTPRPWCIRTSRKTWQETVRLTAKSAGQWTFRTPRSTQRRAAI